MSLPSFGQFLKCLPSRPLEFKLLKLIILDFIGVLFRNSCKKLIVLASVVAVICHGRKIACENRPNTQPMIFVLGFDLPNAKGCCAQETKAYENY